LQKANTQCLPTDMRVAQWLAIAEHGLISTHQKRFFNSFAQGPIPVTEVCIATDTIELWVPEDG